MDSKHVFKEEIVRIINDCDPAGLLAAGAPDDEYSSEIDAVTSRLERDISHQELTDLIITMFNRSFGPLSIITSERCAEIASKLLEASATHAA